MRDFIQANAERHRKTHARLGCLSRPGERKAFYMGMRATRNAVRFDSHLVGSECGTLHSTGVTGGFSFIHGMLWRGTMKTLERYRITPTCPGAQYKREYRRTRLGATNRAIALLKDRYFPAAKVIIEMTTDFPGLPCCNFQSALHWRQVRVFERNENKDAI